MNTLVKKFETHQLDPTNERRWIQEGDRIESKIKDLMKKEKFWNEILKYFLQKEKIDSKYYYKAPIYSRLAIKKLRLGKPYNTVLRYLNFADKDARIKYRGSHVIPDDLSFRRFSQILKCFLRYKNSNHITKKIIENLLRNRSKREMVNKAFFDIYNLSLETPHILHLGWFHFDKLLGRNKYRVLVEENYRGALWLCQKKNEIHRKTNLEQYGLARAVISLCGATIEGILSINKGVCKIIGNKNVKNATLGNYVNAYIRNLRPSSDVTVMLTFLLSIRNQIHPKNRNNRFIIVDMILAIFVLRLTEQIIIKMSHDV